MTHKLSDINLDKMTAFCSECDDYVKVHQRNGGGIVNWRCGRKACNDAKQWYVEKKQKPPDPNRHRLTEIDPVERTAWCSACNRRVNTSSNGGYKGAPRYRCSISRKGKYNNALTRLRQQVRELQAENAELRKKQL